MAALLSREGQRVTFRWRPEIARATSPHFTIHIHEAKQEWDDWRKPEALSPKWSLHSGQTELAVLNECHPPQPRDGHGLLQCGRQHNPSTQTCGTRTSCYSQKTG